MSDILEEVKQDNNITWSEDDEYLINLIHRAENRISDYAGKEINISEDSDARSLLISLVRYMRNKCEDQFEKNYISDILMLRARYRIANMNENEGREEETAV